MLAHCLTSLAAQWRRSPVSAAIGVLTLAVGLASFMLAHAITGFWQRSEQHFANAERIFAVSTDLEFADGSLATGALPMTNEHFAAYLKADYPALAAVARARVISDAAMVATEDRALRLFRVDADPEFLEIFDLPFVAGDSRHALREPGSIVLTQEAAARLFGDRPALGRRVLLSNSVDATVTGVIAAIPEPTHMGRSATASLRFDLLASYDLSAVTASGSEPAASMPENWLVLNTTTYVLLPANGSLPASRLRGQLDSFAERHVPPEQFAFAGIEFGLVPVAGLMVRAGSSGIFAGSARFTLITALSLLGALVLAVASANQAGLATANALGRTRELGVRKAAGATPWQIALRHLLEAGLVTGAGFALAAVAVWLMIPRVQAALGIDLTISLFDVRSLPMLAGLVLGVTLLSGLYPALVLARQSPATALGGQGLHGRRLTFRLVTVQVAATSFLLIAATVTWLQNATLRRSLEAAPDPVLVIENFHTVTGVNPDTLRRELDSIDGVADVTAMARPPWTGVNVLPLTASADEAALKRSAIWHTVGHDFFATLGIGTLAGRTFDREHGVDALPFLQDPDQVNSIVIDRDLLEELGFDSPQAAIDRIVYVPSELMAGFGGGAAHPLRIIGVVENRPLTLAAAGPRGSVYSFAEPLPFLLSRLSTANLEGTLAAIDRLWRQLAPDVALRRRFADELFAEKYAGHARVNRALTALALFALAVSGVGLLAMAKFAMRRRVREVAVRKVYGATTGPVLGRMLAGFARPILLANLIAWPVAWVAARAYLAGFVSPIALSLRPFLACLAMTLVLVGMAVTGQTVRAARSRPSAVLREE